MSFISKDEMKINGKHLLLQFFLDYYLYLCKKTVELAEFRTPCLYNCSLFPLLNSVLDSLGVLCLLSGFCRFGDNNGFPFFPQNVLHLDPLVPSQYTHENVYNLVSYPFFVTLLKKT